MLDQQDRHDQQYRKEQEEVQEGAEPDIKDYIRGLRWPTGSYISFHRGQPGLCRIKIIGGIEWDKED
jgi:hypothetical protein